MIDKNLFQSQRIIAIGMTVVGVYGSLPLPSLATSIQLQSDLSAVSTVMPERSIPTSFFPLQVVQNGGEIGDRGAPRTVGGGSRFQNPSRLRKNRGTPASGQRIGGGSRSGGGHGICQASSKSLTALVPVIPGTPTDSVLGLTFTERPTFWFYLPFSVLSTQPVVFVLKDDQDNIIYQTELSGSGTRPGVVGFKLPENMPPLEVNKRYKWHLTIYCNRQELSDFRTVNGWVERVALDRSFQQELAVATPQQKVLLYAREGIWHEAVTTLAELRRQNPNDDVLKQEWNKLMQEVDLTAIAPEPITSMLTPKK